MSYQERIANMVIGTTDTICRAALAVPEDKRDWVPMGAARTVMSQMQEIATIKDFILPALTTYEFPPVNDATRAQWMEQRNKLSTLDMCILAAKSGAQELAEAIRKVPEEKLDQKIMMPFGGGIEKTIAEVIAMPYWNLCYHEGQINYIQTLLGDREMH
jgi:hypothetical protein